jgi:hypothetical protein
VAAEHRDAAVRPGVSVIGAPQDGRPFLLAAEEETLYTRRLRRNGLLSALAGALATAVVLGLIAARL